jgi:hypothetical protein
VLPYLVPAHDMFPSQTAHNTTPRESIAGDGINQRKRKYTYLAKESRQGGEWLEAYRVNLADSPRTPERIG